MGNIRIRKLMKFSEVEMNAYREFHNKYRSKDSIKMIPAYCECKGITLLNMDLGSAKDGKIGGTTDGSYIAIDFTDNHPLNYFLFWHEYAHYKLHFDKAGNRLSVKIKEQEADIFATFMCDMIFPDNYERFVKFARENPRSAVGH